MKIRINKTSFFGFLFICLIDHCLWGVNASIQRWVNELCCIVILFLFIMLFGNLDFGRTSGRQKYQYGYIVLFILIMGIYSSIQSYVLHGQPLIQGLLPQRFMISGFLFYFLLMKYINEKENAYENLKKIFLCLGYLELFLYITQYLLFKKIQFLQMNYTIRLNDIRMNLDAMAVPYIIFHAANNIYKNRKISWKDILSISAGLFYSFVIAKTRIVLAAYILAFIGGYLVWKKGGKKKIYVFFALFAMFVYLSQTELFAFLIMGLKNMDLSAQTRVIGREYYIDRILEHPLFGCGYINLNNAYAATYAGVKSGIYWVDLGIYGLTFFFGFIGLIWVIILFKKMAVMSFRLTKGGNLTFWMYMLYMIVLSPNGTGFLWYMSNTVGLVIWMSLLEGSYKKTYFNNHTI